MGVGEDDFEGLVEAEAAGRRAMMTHEVGLEMTALN